ncbi:unnamed protein product [Schistocephalus solidus]|uniref:Reverse transcriptase domain-containing protein n=1 Tax=Schistocephalus solidus TaxID=70667 RepID=A0A183SHJ5_SCHSO|nr:unnamed protein product [Schistocephalus solidus]
MLLWPPITGAQLYLVAPRSWVLPSAQTPGHRHDRRAKTRGISLNITGNICTRVLLNRLTIHLELGKLPECKFGFRRNRCIASLIFAARQLQGKCQDMRTHLYTTFVDLTRALDMANRDGL